MGEKVGGQEAFPFTATGTLQQSVDLPGERAPRGMSKAGELPKKRLQETQPRLADRSREMPRQSSLGKSGIVPVKDFTQLRAAASGETGFVSVVMAQLPKLGAKFPPRRHLLTQALFSYRCHLVY